ncbi:hypothetical protein FF011L_38690 [Roseimaritima multifibrata]|uniref:Uncharacterized protein n=1 Tax=Roseimaritima multifibrata TaxID=1930274 RepID=A0A517MJK9_9BACT|nr:hypothetical protein FF011L_38690 [Roseimaritima multifibrata]
MHRLWTDIPLPVGTTIAGNPSVHRMTILPNFARGAFMQLGY